MQFDLEILLGSFLNQPSFRLLRKVTHDNVGHLITGKSKFRIFVQLTVSRRSDVNSFTVHQNITNGHIDIHSGTLNSCECDIFESAKF